MFCPTQTLFLVLLSFALFNLVLFLALRLDILIVVAIVFIFVPIFLPVVQELDLSGHVTYGNPLVWFCTLIAVNLQTAFLSPPVAMASTVAGARSGNNGKPLR